MDFVIREMNSYKREMSVTVPWNGLEEAFEQAAARFGRGVRLPGFRKGKLPRRILFRNFGREIEADFIQEAVQKYYLEVLKEKNISPVSQAKIDDVHFERGESLSFKATFEMEPDVQLPNYKKKFKIKKNVYVPDVEDVDIYIEEARRQFAELRTVETGSEEAHLLLVDMQELERTGLPIIGRKVENRYIQVGDGVFGGENLDRLTGLKAGDEVVIEVKGEAENTRSKYRLTIKNVHEEIVPELNDEFIKKLDESAANEAEFRQNVMNKITARLQRDSASELRQSIRDYFVRNMSLEVPESMVENYVENALDDARKNDGEAFSEGSSRDEVAFRKEMKPPAVRNLKWYLIRKAIVEAEGFTVDDEEVEARIQQILENADEGKGQIRRFYRKPSNREHLREDLLDKKLFHHLTSFIKADEVKVFTRDLRRQRGGPPKIVE
ncbi:MAG: trigger factor [Candidatus Neomarinimicrobiota bacterium]